MRRAPVQRQSTAHDRRRTKSRNGVRATGARIWGRSGSGHRPNTHAPVDVTDERHSQSNVSLGAAGTLDLVENVGVAPVAPRLGNVLTLPRFSPDVPVRLIGKPAAESTRQFATALLKCGVLREADWNGSLESSMQLGMERWVRECGGKADRKCHVDFFFCDDVTGLGMLGSWDRDDLNRRMANRPTKGIFGLRHDPYGDVDGSAIGNAVVALEKLYPRAGWTLYQVINLAASFTMNCFTPEAAVNSIDYRLESWRDDPDEWIRNYADGTHGGLEDALAQRAQSGDSDALDEIIGVCTGALTPRELQDSVPSEFFTLNNKPSRAVLERALAQCDHHYDGHPLGLEVQWLEDGIALLDIVRKAKTRGMDRSGDINGMFSMLEIPTTFLRWSVEDRVVRAFDDELEWCSQCDDDTTDVTWHIGFDAADAKSVGLAAEHARSAIQMASLVDKLMDAMNSPVPVPLEFAGIEIPVHALIPPTRIRC